MNMFPSCGLHVLCRLNSSLTYYKKYGSKVYVKEKTILAHLHLAFTWSPMAFISRGSPRWRRRIVLYRSRTRCTWVKLDIKLEAIQIEFWKNKVCFFRWKVMHQTSCCITYFLQFRRLLDCAFKCHSSLRVAHLKKNTSNFKPIATFAYQFCVNDYTSYIYRYLYS